jgi:hypothetical protein
MSENNLYALVNVENNQVIQYDFDYQKLKEIAEKLNAYWVSTGKPVKYTVLNFN